MEISKNAVQPRLASDNNAGFFPHLARQRRQQGFVPLDAATGEMPAGAVTMPDQQNVAPVADHDALSAKRHAAPEPPIGKQYPLDQRAQTRPLILPMPGLYCYQQALI